MTRIVAVDPGSSTSWWVTIDTAARPALPGAWPVVGFGSLPNPEMLDMLRTGGPWMPDTSRAADVVVVESPASFMLRVGVEVFETAIIAGQFVEAAHPRSALLPRTTVKGRMLHAIGGNDGDVRAAIIDRYGAVGGKASAVGTKASPGPLFGIKADVWQALAVALVWADMNPAGLR